jgi:hypothetical protein
LSEETLGFIHARFAAVPGLKSIFEQQAKCVALKS